MNALAKTLRMERTHFVNPHGIETTARSLPYSTASDMVRLTRYAVSKAAFRFYVSQKERQISFNRGDKKLGYMLRNTNELLGRDGVDGVKTGRTTRAGDCLILPPVGNLKSSRMVGENGCHSPSSRHCHAWQRRPFW